MSDIFAANIEKTKINIRNILDNVYKIMQNFGKLYVITNDEKKKNLIT